MNTSRLSHIRVCHPGGRHIAHPAHPHRRDHATCVLISKRNWAVASAPDIAAHLELHVFMSPVSKSVYDLAQPVNWSAPIHPTTLAPLRTPRSSLDSPIRPPAKHPRAAGRVRASLGKIDCRIPARFNASYRCPTLHLGEVHLAAGRLLSRQPATRPPPALRRLTKAVWARSVRPDARRHNSGNFSLSLPSLNSHIVSFFTISWYRPRDGSVWAAEVGSRLTAGSPQDSG